MERKETMQSVAFWESSFAGKEYAELNFSELPEATEALVRVLTKNTSLKTIKLLVKDDEPVIVIADVLKINKTLINLKIHSKNHNSWEGIGDSGAIALATALKINTTLQTLTIYACNAWKDEGTTALADSLKEHPTLTTVVLDAMEAGNKSAKDMADVLKVNKTLLSLDLFFDSIKDEGVEFLAEALKVNNTLQRISIGTQQCSLSEKSLQAINAMLDSNHKVRVDFFPKKNVSRTLQNEVRGKLDRNYRNHIQDRVTELHQNLAKVLDRFSKDVVGLVTGYAMSLETHTKFKFDPDELVKVAKQIEGPSTVPSSPSASAGITASPETPAETPKTPKIASVTEALAQTPAPTLNQFQASVAYGAKEAAPDKTLTPKSESPKEETQTRPKKDNP